MDLTQLETAFRNAHNAGDTAAAQALADEIRRVRAGQSSGAQASPAPEPNPIPDWAQSQLEELHSVTREPGAFVQNVFGYGEVDTPGEQAGRVIQSLGAGNARAVEGGVNLPGALMGAIESRVVRPAYNAIMPESMEVGSDTPSAFPQPVNLPSSLTDFDPQNRAERIAGTIGEFMPGAALIPAGGVGLLGRLLRFGAIPGAASELAGEVTEGTAAEPWARLGAGLLAGIAATPRPTQYGAGLASGDDVAEGYANFLAERGVRPTAGQAGANPILKGIEGAAAPSGSQLDDFTSAALRTMGVDDAARATDDVMLAGQRQITDGMNDILGNLDVPITPSIGPRVLSVHDDFFTGTPGQALPVRLRNVANELLDTATSPTPSPIPATTLREWRTRLGNYTTSTDEAVRDAAHALRSVIDDASSAALTQAGRVDDVATLSGLRTQYQNFYYIVNAVKGAGEESALGILTPARIRAAVSRPRDALRYATGRGTELSQLGRAGVGVMSPASTVAPEAARTIRGFLPSAVGASSLSGATMYATGSPTAALAAGVGGLLARPAMRAATRSGLGQSLLTDLPNVARSAAATLPGGLLQFGEN